MLGCLKKHVVGVPPAVFVIRLSPSFLFSFLVLGFLKLDQSSRSMSAIERIKARLREQKHMESRGMGGGGGSGKGGPREIVVLPPKPTKRRKLLEVQKEAKESLARIPGGGAHRATNNNKAEDQFDDEEMADDPDDDVQNKPQHVPWGPPELLHNLDKPEIVGNLDYVIQLVKQKENEVPVTAEDKKNGAKGDKKKEIIVWDHSKTKQGKESDNNFFLWLEAYAAVEDKICQREENMIFQ